MLFAVILAGCVQRGKLRNESGVHGDAVGKTFVLPGGDVIKCSNWFLRQSSVRLSGCVGGTGGSLGTKIVCVHGVCTSQNDEEEE